MPKKSTQNAGSKENEANELLCGIEAPAAVLGTLKLEACTGSTVGYAYTAVAATETAAARSKTMAEVVQLIVEVAAL